MPTLAQFLTRCKIRHDFADQFQVQYQHPGGDHYDSWVSGEEVLQRLASAAREQRLKAGILGLTWDQIRQAREELPDRMRGKLHDWLQERLASAVEANLGDNVIGDSLADRIRGQARPDDPRAVEKAYWQTLASDDAFRRQLLELAWINLAGSLPDEPAPEPDDWL